MGREILDSELLELFVCLETECLPGVGCPLLRRLLGEICGQLKLTLDYKKE